MKTTISKIISVLAAATVLLSASFTTVPTPIQGSDDSIPVIQIDLESDKNKDGDEGNEAEPQCDEPIDSRDEISQ